MAYLTPTVGIDFEAEIEIKRSRFLGFARRINDEADARDFISSIRKTFYDARHVCHAFVLGPLRDIQRSSDDGEPAGTAGIPILDAIVKRTVMSQTTPTDSPSSATLDTAPGTGAQTPGLYSAEDATQFQPLQVSDVCVIVVRYFGGIKLGAGGLVQAYSDTAAATLDAARFVLRQEMQLLSLEIDPGRAAKLETSLRALKYSLQPTQYSQDGAKLTIAVPATQAALKEIEARIQSLTSGSVRLEPQSTCWVDCEWPT